MSEDFKPGTRPLLRLAGLDAVRVFVSRAEESHVLWAAVMALLMRLYLEPDAEVRRATGPSDPQVLSALRAALGENFGIEAADYLSWALIRYGCRQKPTLASLHPWEKLMFEWQQRRANAPRIALMLKDAGLDKPLRPAQLELLDGWINRPESAIGEASVIVATLFGTRLVSFNLHDDGTTPAHDVLFRTLVAAAVPSTTLVAPRQHLVQGATGPHWRIEYTHNDLEQSFEAAANGTALDVDAVAAAVDDLLRRLGWTERIFRLAPGRAGNGELGLFVAAEGARFAEIAWRLRLPLLRSPAEADVAAFSAAEQARRGAAPGAGRWTGAGAGYASKDPATAFPTTNGDALSVLESRFTSILPLERDADPVMRTLLTSLRRSFGAGRMLQGSRWLRQSRAQPPAWLSATPDPVGILYERQDVLFRKGRIGWGALVEIDPAAFEAGIEDRPGILVYSADEYFDSRPAELSMVGSRLVELRATGSTGTSELSRFGQLIRNDTGRPLNVPVPVAMNSHGVMLTSFMAVRAHLPNGVLRADWFPVLTHASSVVPMIVPFAYWPPALIAAWNQRRLCLDPQRGPEAATRAASDAT